MGIELCRFTGGTCNLCGEGNVCLRTPSIDHSVVSTFKEHKGRPVYPTCPSYEGHWLRVLTQVHSVDIGGNNAFRGLSKVGAELIRVYPNVSLNVSRWFDHRLGPCPTVLLEKNPDSMRGGIYNLDAYGAQNGLALYHGVPFAVSTRRFREVMRPVVRAQRQSMLSAYAQFEAKFGSVYNS